MAFSAPRLAVHPLYVMYSLPDLIMLYRPADAPRSDLAYMHIAYGYREGQCTCSPSVRPISTTLANTRDAGNAESTRVAGITI